MKTRWILLVTALCAFCLYGIASATPFIRGDANHDEKVEISDAIYLQNYIYQSGPAPFPLDAGDANDDGAIDTADGVYLLNFLFNAGEAPKEPFTTLGEDPTPDNLEQPGGQRDTQGPSLKVISPQDGALLDFPMVEVKVEANDPSGVDRVLVNSNLALLSGGRYSYTLILKPAGNIPITVRATDKLGNFSEKTIRVNLRINSPPSLAPIGDKTIEETKELRFTITATDRDGDRLNYSAANLPQGARFNAATRTFSWVPTVGQAGTYRVTFRVDDGKGGVGAETINIVVSSTTPEPPMRGNSMRLVSSRTSVSRGGTFEVELHIRSEIPILGYQSAVRFNPACLKLSEVTDRGTDLEGWHRAPRAGMMGMPGFFLYTIGHEKGWAMLGQTFFLTRNPQDGYIFRPGQDYHAMTLKFAVPLTAPRGTARIYFPPMGDCFVPSPFGDCSITANYIFINEQSLSVDLLQGNLISTQVEIRDNIQ